MGFKPRWPIHAERVLHEHLVDYLTTDADGGPCRRAPSTLDRQRTVLRGFWRWASREGYVKVDPAEGLQHLYLGTGERRPGRWLTRDEANRLLEACEAGDQGQRDRTLILVALLTGLRRAELAALIWRSVDLSQGRLSVNGKGGKLATIGLPDQAACALAGWRQVVSDRQGRRAPGPNQPVFPTGRKFGGLNNSLEDYEFLWNQPLTVYTVRAIVARPGGGGRAGHGRHPRPPALLRRVPRRGRRGSQGDPGRPSPLVAGCDRSLLPRPFTSPSGRGRGPAPALTASNPGGSSVLRLTRWG